MIHHVKCCRKINHHDTNNISIINIFWLALDNMWWCEGCGHVNYTPGTTCKVCGRRSMAGVLCENSFLKRRLVETQAEMESAQRDLKRARTTIMDREE